jgi:hypothetical protein
MLKMNLITQEELYGELYGDLYWELYDDLYWKLHAELLGELYGELYLELWELGTQIRIDFHNSKFRGYNTVC